VPERFTVRIDGNPHEVEAGATVAAALWNARQRACRTSVAGELRGVLCAMGICFECRVTINGVAHRRACLETVAAGMEIRTRG
jgi:sarcosine oxidase subunit alpha